MMGNLNFNVTFGTQCYTKDTNSIKYVGLRNSWDTSDEIHEKIESYLQRLAEERHTKANQTKDVVSECICFRGVVVYDDKAD